MKRMALLVASSALLASTMSATAADHELRLIPSNTHTGSFDARIRPVLRIVSGDTVKVETLVAFGMDRLLAAGASEAEIPDFVKEMDKYMKEKGLYGGTLTGPLYVEGAQTGDMLEVQILPGIEFLHPFGWTGSAAAARCPTTFRTRATNSSGSTLRPAPFNSVRASRSRPRRSGAQSASRLRWRAATFRTAFRAPTPAISTLRKWYRAAHSTSQSTFPARSSRSATATRCRATVR